MTQSSSAANYIFRKLFAQYIIIPTRPINKSDGVGFKSILLYIFDFLTYISFSLSSTFDTNVHNSTIYCTYDEFPNIVSTIWSLVKHFLLTKAKGGKSAEC